MANIRINFLNHSDIPFVTDTICVTGAKQTKTWIRKNYPNDIDALNNEFYFIRKHNAYGIKWVIKTISRFGDCKWDLVVYGKCEKRCPEKYRITIL